MRYLLLLFLFAGQLGAGETIYLTPSVDVVPSTHSTVTPEVPAEAQPTPHTQIRKVLWSVLKLTDKDEFVDFGCGPDARVVIAAGFGIKSKCIGIEIDPVRARLAKTQVERLGLSNVTIIEGDATQVNVQANVGFAFLYPEVLYELIPNIIKLDRFVSYKHPVPGLPMKQIGEFWYWDKSMLKVAETGTWNNQEWDHVVCNDPTCPMCYGPSGIAIQIQRARQHNARIDELLANLKQSQPEKKVENKAKSSYTDQTYKVQCSRGYCVYETWRTFSDGSKVRLNRWRVDN